MIEVRELRIGSLVDYQGETREVAQLTQYGEVWLDVEEGEQDMCQTGELYGIPLTEAWLEKFNMPTGMFNDNEYFSVARLNSDSETWGLYYEDGFTAVIFRYTYQLQNIYFALTGQELTLKEEI